MKRCCLLLFLITSPIQIHAQKNTVQYGFQTGPSFVNLYGNPFIETFLESEIRLTGGPAVYYPFSKHWSVKSNLFFEVKGAGGILPLFDEVGDLMGFYNAKISYSYLTIPLLFEYNFGNRMKGNLTAGPYMGTLLSQKSTFTEPVLGEKIVVSGTSNYIPLDGGLILGAGGRYAVNRRINVSLEGRFNIGMTNIVSRPVMNSLTIYTLASHILVGVYYTPGYYAGKVRGVNP